MCISTWKEFFPDYRFQFWNEENFNIDECRFAKEAYETGIFAFVSDYCRAKVLYEFGGIYLDTDVKVLKKFPEIVASQKGLLGFERRAFLGTAVIGCEPKNDTIGELLSFYEKRTFIRQNGQYDNIANVALLTEIMQRKGLKTGGERQTVDGFEIYNREYFYPKKLGEQEFRVTDETVAIHMFSASWLTERERKRGNNRFWIEVVRPLLRWVHKIGRRLFGDNFMHEIEIKVRNALR
jgi:hypothetical protein